MLVKKEVNKRVKNLPKRRSRPNNGSKRRSKGVKNLTIDRVWVKMEVKMGLTKKEVLPKMGIKKEVKKGAH